MDWKEYEARIMSHFRKVYPGASVRRDVKLDGIISQQKRQVDILIEDSVAGLDVRIVVDCKYFSRQLDVTHVESFLGFLGDVRASKGVLITNKGFSPAARNRASYGHQDIDLMVIDLDDLESYQDFCAVHSDGKYHFLVSAPNGWVVNRMRNNPAFYLGLHPAEFDPPQGFDGESDAFSLAEDEGFMYFSYWLKNEECPALKDLLEDQKPRIRELYGNADVEYLPGIQRGDCETTLRSIDSLEAASHVEYMMFFDYSECILSLCCIAPRAEHERYLTELKWTAERIVAAKTKYDSSGKPVGVELVKKGD